MDFLSVADNLKRVNDRIIKACGQAGRNADEVTLICVTKTKPVEMIRQAIDAGARNFGENYVQEAQTKIEEIAESNVRWHMIGHLQSNKSGKAAALFDMVQSVDSLKLAQRLSKSAVEAGRSLEVLIEVNTAGEQSKTGTDPEQALDLAEEVSKLKNLHLVGIMGIPPFFSDPEEVRPYFVKLRELFQRLPAENRKVLSMGMSGDFEAAIQEGSTMVRVGSAIFGERF